MTVTHGLVGNTWQGLQLSITQGDTTITQAGGKPLTVTSPNTLESGGFNVLSESFCLGYGTWTVRMNKPTHPEMASYNTSAKAYLTLEERLAPGAPINAVPVKPQAIVNWANKTLNVDGDVNNFGGSKVESLPDTEKGRAAGVAHTGVYGFHQDPPPDARECKQLNPALRTAIALPRTLQGLF